MKWSQLSHLPKEQLREIQNKKLAYFMKHELPYSPFYRQLFIDHKLRFSKIRTTDDLQNVPFTSKEDLAPTVEEPAKPRGFILQPDEKLIRKVAPKEMLAKILWKKARHQDAKQYLEYFYKPIHMHFTTGRSATPTPFVYTGSDVEIFRQAGERMLDVAGVTRDLSALNAFPYAPHLAFWQTYNALTKLGMTSLQTGGGKIMGTQKIMDAIERLKMGVVTFIPGYGYHMLREAVKQKKDFSSLKFVISGGERASAGMKEKVKGLLAQLGAKDVQYLSTYAFTEGKTAWIQCHERSGYHTYPDLEFFEVVDKEGKRVEDGQPGELVYTSLGWRGSVVVRYRTGDMVEGIEYEPCPHCGKTVPRIKMDIQRSTEIKEFNLTKVKGELVNLNQFYPVLSKIPELEEWQVEIRKKNNDPYEIDEIVVYIAQKEGVPFDMIRSKINQLLHNEIFISAQVIEKPLNELLEMLGMETELKEKRIVDNRPKD